MKHGEERYYPMLSYSGDSYIEIGDFIREEYLNVGFTQGMMQEADFLTDLLALPPGAMLLDVRCEPGRHTMELAGGGIRLMKSGAFFVMREWDDEN